MDWNNALVLKLISVYEKYPVIWNPNQLHYKNRQKVNDGWLALEKELGVPVHLSEVKKKIDSLRAQYRFLRRKVAESHSSAKVYKPAWFAFDDLHRFLSTTSKKVATEKAPEDIETGSCVRETDSCVGEEGIIKKEPEVHITDIVEDGESVPLEPNHVYGKRRQEENLEEVRKQLKLATEALQAAPQAASEDDACSLYGRLLADKLRGISYRSRVIVQNKIDNLIFEAQMVEIISSGENVIPSSSATYAGNYSTSNFPNVDC